jgi:hypothetical protein
MAMNLAEQPSEGTTWGYLRGMETWTGAMFELLAHAAERADGPSIRGRLMGARDDAESLRDLLFTATRREEPSPSANSIIESICSLWDANQHYFEQLAAHVDPDFYRAWQARSGSARMGRNGSASAKSGALPHSA